MFFVNNKLLRKREVLFLRVIPTLVVFLAFISVTAVSYVAAHNATKEEQKKELQNANQQIASTLAQRMQSYEIILKSGTSLFTVTEQVTREQWRTFVSAYEIEQNYPGVQAIGYVDMLEPEDVAGYLTALSADGFDVSTIRPAGERDRYSGIILIEPLTARNAGSFGYDMYASDVRRVAMDRARDAAAAAITDIVLLEQESRLTTQQPGFLMYVPVYTSNSMPDSAEERISKLQGYVYAPFRAYDLVNSTLVNVPDNYGFKLFADGEEEEALLYENESFSSLANENTAEFMSNDFDVAGKTWRLVGVTSSSILSPQTRNRPLNALIGGLLFSVLVAGFIYLLLGNRARALASKEARSIQEAKDELLALASHQLRTPATGVKQYVGMLREGFAGELSDTQRMLLEKAYDSNERQLDTINEMLFVARADAGQLRIENVPFDLVTMVLSIVEEQKQAMQKKSQKLTVHIPDDEILCRGDKQYLYMAIDNIVNNASKYTHEGGEISVKLYVKSEVAVLHVEDNGVGVADKDKHLLFKKFSRIPNELTTQVSGSGIGLYFTKRVVDAHDGKIVFDSKQAKGSRVTILLRLEGPLQK